MSGECEKCHEHTLDCLCKYLEDDFRPKSLVRLAHEERIWQNIQRSKILEQINSLYLNKENDV